MKPTVQTNTDSGKLQPAVHQDVALLCSQLTERKKNGLTSSQNALYFSLFRPLSLPPPIHLPIPFPNQASRGFSTATAFLLCSSAHPALPQSISPLCHSQPTVAPRCPYLPSFAPHPPCSDSCHCEPCSRSVLGCCVRMGSLLPCCSVYMSVCVHVCVCTCV